MERHMKSSSDFFQESVWIWLLKSFNKDETMESLRTIDGVISAVYPKPRTLMIFQML